MSAAGTQEKVHYRIPYKMQESLKELRHVSVASLY